MAFLPAGAITLTGSGATFPAPLYASWIFAYQSVDPVAAINYQPTGSGAGKKAIIDRTVDFAGSDALVTDAEYAAGGDLQMFPIVAGAVVPAFNVTDTANQKVLDLTLSRAVLANIFLGKITKWNDPAIQSLNTKVKLPNKIITVAHRSDGSGTTDIFTKALSSFSTEWASKVGHGTTVQWPTGLGGSGNAGVAAIIKNTPYSIGYVELAYAVSNKLAYASMTNKAGSLVKANGASIISAMQDFSGGFSAKLTEDIVDAPGTLSWPIAAYTYLVLHMNQTDCAKAGTLLTYMNWTLTNAQAGGIATSLGYAQLPGEVRAQTLARMKKVTCNGAPVLP
jgi:phosphate transport system substrate-binding protein